MEPMVPTASKDTQGQEKQRAGQGKKGRRGLTLLRLYAVGFFYSIFLVYGIRPASAFMDAFIQYSKGQDLPDVLQAFLKKDNKDTKEDLRQQQRHLNLHRNVLQKIEAKKRAIKKDEDQWQNWVKEVKETIKTQKTKHEENMEKLQTELAELEKKEEEIRAGREADESAPIEIEEEDDAFEELFQTGKKDNSRKVDQEKDKAEENVRIQMMKEALEQEYQRKLEEACQSAQMCMQQQMQMHMMALAGQPPPGMDPIPAAMHPMEGGTSLPEPTKVGPFMRRSNVREAHSPYTRTQENKETMSERLKMTHGEAAEALAQQKGEGWDEGLLKLLSLGLVWSPKVRWGGIHQIHFDRIGMWPWTACTDFWVCV